MLQAFCTFCGFQFGHIIKRCIQSITCGSFQFFWVKTLSHKLLSIITKLCFVYCEGIICESQGTELQALLHPKF